MRLIYTFCFLFIGVSTSFANNILVQNVTTTGNNATNKTIQVQFDLSWDNSWRDAINWDAAWVFMKFKDANGVWQHAKLNQAGFNNGSGTANTIQVTTDKIGSWIHRSAQGSGIFNSTNMQLQWNYGLSGLNDVAGLEVRVFAVEMVYVPQGEFNVAKTFNLTWNPNNRGIASAPGNNFPVINTKLSPTINYNDLFNQITLKIKGDAGLDTDNNGSIDNTTYPTGYFAFYCYKYEMTEQQYADFLNTLTATQVTTLGLAGTGITLNGGQYFSSTPNKACNNASTERLFAYADWSGVRPMSCLEFNKASYGPLQPVSINYFGNSCCNHGYVAWGSSNSGPDNFATTATEVGYADSPNSTKASAGASYFGILELTGSALEPVVRLISTSFTSSNGNGVLSSSGTSDIVSWLNGFAYDDPNAMMIFIDQHNDGANQPYGSPNYGFRYVRSAE